MKSKSPHLCLKSALGFLVSVFVLTSCDNATTPKLLEKLNADAEITKETEVFIKGKVDVLFVVDDSRSMSAHQRRLANNIDQYIRVLVDNERIDFHIAVVSSDMENTTKQGRFQGNPRVITRRTPNFQQAIRRNLQLGTDGSFKEKFADPVRTALGIDLLNAENRDFLRPDAVLAIFFLTDSSDYSSTSGRELLNFLVGLKGTDNMVAHGAISLPGVNPRSCYRDDGASTVIKQFIASAGGRSFSICSPDFGKELALAGTEIEVITGFFIPFESVPILSSIRVYFGDQEIPKHPTRGWSYDPERVGISLGEGVEVTGQPGMRPEIKVKYKVAVSR